MRLHIRARSRRSADLKALSTARRAVVVVESLEGRIVLSPLTWFAGPDLPAPKAVAVAAHAPGGSVLVFGGGDTVVNQLVDVPNAALGSWRAALSPLDSPRLFAGVGTVPAGFLVYGGTDGGGSMSGALNYNPYNADATQDAAEMSTARSHLGFATDGMTPYAIGGLGEQGAALASVERYDAASDSWTTVAPLPEPLYGTSAVDDGQGHILVFGGQTTYGAPNPNVYQYSIATDVWSMVGAMPVPEHDGAAVLAPDSRVYVLGGIGATGTLDNVQEYDPASGQWSSLTPLPAPISSEAAAIDSLGRIVVVGGYDANHNPTADVSVSQQIAQPDQAPTFTSVPPTTHVLLGAAFIYQVASSGNPQPTYSLISAPAGMSIDPNTGLLNYIPSPIATGPISVDVRAANYAGQTDQTFTLTFITPAPTNLIAKATGPTSIQLNWTAPANSPSIDHYQVYERHFIHSPRGSGGGYTYGLVGDAGSATSFAVTGLKPGSAHTYVVKAVATGAAPSAFSNAAGAQTYLSPSFYPPASQFITATRPLSFQLYTTASPPATYSVLNSPAGLSVNPATGAVTWTPPATAVGQVQATVRASNIAGYADQTINITVTALGDINHDGKVNFSDLNILISNFGKTGATYAMGDLNGDGVVNFADFNLLAADFARQSRSTIAGARMLARAAVAAAADAPTAALPGQSLAAQRK